MAIKIKEESSNFGTWDWMFSDREFEDDATNNAHILLGDTQPSGNYAIYSDSSYSSNLTGALNVTGGYATDTGTGWSGTYTVDEGVVTVRHGIIIDVDWD